MKSLNLGLGLLSIGRQWGAANTEPPSKRQAFELLEQAYALGIRFFDTAPAYGTSEEIFGEFLKAHGGLDDITVATKFGEHWCDDSKSTTVDHSFERLKASLDQSMDLLGKIDILQVHKATDSVLKSQDISEALAYAKTLGIHRFGASISDMKGATTACSSGKYDFLQFPFNFENDALKDLLELLNETNIKPIINRPLNMGHMIKNNASPHDEITKAFGFIKNTISSGIVLTGTSKVAHLKTNIACFKAA
ncbi:aldo/keto reductase [Kiloniella antarctica]|uniref:Aldo/keto reductase n=1 Tax=Kiloniella antarctica TaxID=1550907 RepID=A0ABW5BI24_9PROT